MTPAEYRSLQNRLNRQTAVQTLAVLQAAQIPDTTARLARLAILLFAVLNPQRAASRDLAGAYYASQAPTGRAPTPDQAPYSPADTRVALERFQPRWLAAETPRQQQAARTAVTAAAIRHGEQGGREAVLQSTRMDGIRFARIDPRPPACAFCLVLIGRGAVYLSDNVRSGGFLAHDHDTCVPVPVWDPTDWPGRDQAEAAEDFYIQHAAGAPGAQLSAMRRAVAEHGSPI